MGYESAGSDLSPWSQSLPRYFLLYSSNLHFAVIQIQCSRPSPSLVLHLFAVKQIKIRGHRCATVSATDQ